MTAAIESQWPLMAAGQNLPYMELADTVQHGLQAAGCAPLGLSHFALVVGDIHSTLRWLSASGDPAWRDARVVWGEAFGCHAAMHHQDGVELEVLQPVRPSFLLDALGQNGDALHHLCFNVGDIERALETLRGRGETPVDGRIYDGLHGRISFFAPGALCPLHLELCEPRHAPATASPA